MSSIEWTDLTWNPVTGCTRVSPGCANCYIERTIPFRTARRRFERVGNTSSTGVELHPERLLQPLAKTTRRWRRPRRVFVNSMSDLFHEDVPDSFIDQVFAIMALASTHTFQVLTKRPERMLDYFDAPSTAMIGKSVDARVGRLAMELADARGEDINHPFWPLPNVWLGVSVENQYWADRRIPDLLQLPAALLFLSVEPLLKPVDLRPWVGSNVACSSCADTIGSLGASCLDCGEGTYVKGEPSSDIGWVIVGGESGPGARPFDTEWARTIVRQCRSSRVPVFIKQLGSVWAKANFATDKGGDITEWPEDLRVREWPAPAQPSYQTASGVKA